MNATLPDTTIGANRFLETDAGDISSSAFAEEADGLEHPDPNDEGDLIAFVEVDFCQMATLWPRSACDSNFRRARCSLE